MKQLINILVVVVVLLPGSSFAGTYGGGTGTEGDPYQIGTAEQMNAIGLEPDDWDKHFILMDDIDLSVYMGEEFNIIGEKIYDGGWKGTFTGVFDGDGHTIFNFTWSSDNYRTGLGIFEQIVGGKISNLTLDRPVIDASRGSIFGSLAGLLKSGEIVNCHVEGGYVEGRKEIGGLVGINYGTIRDCYTHCQVVGSENNIGGLVGENHGNIFNCYSTSSVTGDSNVGGLTGESEGGVISNCHTEVSVKGNMNVGGLVGNTLYDQVSDCSSVGSVTGKKRTGGLIGCGGIVRSCQFSGYVSGEGCTGGLVGNYATVEKCWAEGVVIGMGEVGGLVGFYGTITDSYSLAKVSGGGQVGGLIGREGIISTSYSMGAVSGTSEVGGVAGSWSTINNCYSSSDVFGDSQVGGLMGCYGSISKSYSCGSVSGTTDVGGIIGLSGSVLSSFWDIDTSGVTESAGGTGKTTTEMKTESTFAGWTCKTVWTIDDGNDYPRLVWQNAPGELIHAPDSVYGGGTGTTGDPYLIENAEHLNSIGLFECDWDKCFVLTADIDLGSLDGKEGRGFFNMIGGSSKLDMTPFSGVFDGGGHTISRFTYRATSDKYVGLFRCVEGDNAEIRNVGMLDPNIVCESGSYIGSLVGQIDSGTVKNCFVEGNGLLGRVGVGGLVGSNWGIIRECYSLGNKVNATSGGCGGLVCWNYGVLSSSFASSVISGQRMLGGLCGLNYGSIINCYSEGLVSGREYVGGLVGYNAESISKCYTMCTVNGEYLTGGLVGKSDTYWGCPYPDETFYPWRPVVLDYSAVISSSYCSGNETGQEYSYWRMECEGCKEGPIGFPITYGCAIAGQWWNLRSTDQMKQQSTYSGWDFTNETTNGTADIWFIPQGDYPRLWWEGMGVSMKLTPVSLNCRSEGNWVKAHITLPEEFTVADVDSDRPVVLHSFGLESAYMNVFINEDGLVEIEAAIEREDICSLANDWPESLTLYGFLSDGSIFLGTSTVRILPVGLEEVVDLASYWLQGDCVYPDWCDGIDLNRDSIVNLVDYHLLLNSQVEFVSE